MIRPKFLGTKCKMKETLYKVHLVVRKTNEYYTVNTLKGMFDVPTCPGRIVRESYGTVLGMQTKPNFQNLVESSYGTVKSLTASSQSPVMTELVILHPTVVTKVRLDFHIGLGHVPENHN